MVNAKRKIRMKDKNDRNFYKENRQREETTN